MEEQTIINKQVYPPRIAVKKNFAGEFGWEISFSGDDTDEVIRRISEVNKQLKEKFKSG